MLKKILRPDMDAPGHGVPHGVQESLTVERVVNKDWHSTVVWTGAGCPTDLAAAMKRPSTWAVRDATATQPGGPKIVGVDLHHLLSRTPSGPAREVHAALVLVHDVPLVVAQAEEHVEDRTPGLRHAEAPGSYCSTGGFHPNERPSPRTLQQPTL
jgi:hypothetical protein